MTLLPGGDFGLAWGGVSSLQLGLSLVWSEARRRGIGLAQVVQWMASKPADLVGLRSKGRIALGYDADLAVFAPDAAYVVDPQRLHHKNKVSAYAGRSLSGVVRRTLLGGRDVDVAGEPHGRLLRRGSVERVTGAPGAPEASEVPAAPPEQG